MSAKLLNMSYFDCSSPPRPAQPGNSDKNALYAEIAADVLLALTPDGDLALFVHGHVNHHRPAANRVVLGVCLLVARGQVDRHNDFLAAGVAEVGGFVLHESVAPSSSTRRLKGDVTG